MSPFDAKRAAMLEEYYSKFFLLGGWLGATDTYKRTMWTAVPDIAVARAGYALTMQAVAGGGGRSSSSSWPGTRRCSRNGFIGRCCAPTSSWRDAGLPNTRRPGRFHRRSGSRCSRRAAGRRDSPPHRHLGLSRRADVFAAGALLVVRRSGRRRIVSRAGDVPILRADSVGHEGPAHEVGDSPRDAEFGLRSTLGGGAEYHRYCWLAMSAAAGSSLPTIPRSSSFPTCSSRSAPSATK